MLRYVRGKAVLKESRVFVLPQVTYSCVNCENFAKNCGSGVNQYFWFHRPRQISTYLEQICTYLDRKETIEERPIPPKHLP